MRALALPALLVLLAPLLGAPGAAAWSQIPLSRRAIRARKYANRVEPYVQYAERPKEPPVLTKLDWINEVHPNLRRYEDHKQPDSAVWTEHPAKSDLPGWTTDFTYTKSGAFQGTLPVVVDLTSEYSETANRVPQERMDLEERGARMLNIALDMVDGHKKYNKKHQWSPPP
eukprot:2877472-Pyramimonas_sp.AAC.1